MEQIEIDTFNTYRREIPQVDVRSPIEFCHASIPGSENIPLFSDDERARIGWTYKHKGETEATALGESLAVPRIPYYLKQVEGINRDGRILLLCARGGLRSLRFARLLEESGYTVYRLKGGYKSYRQQVLSHFNDTINLVLLAGRTGCGKTQMLNGLKGAGEQVLDLEGLASHRGSAFGGFSGREQPSNEFFENCLSEEIRRLDPDRRVWVEDESQNIGKVLLPGAFYRQMCAAPQYLVDREQSSRIERLCEEYGHIDKPILMENLSKIRKRLGNEDYQKALKALDRGELQRTVTLVLEYYDKCYDYSLSKKSRVTLGEIFLNKRDSETAVEQILIMSDTNSVSG